MKNLIAIAVLAFLVGCGSTMKIDPPKKDIYHIRVIPQDIYKEYKKTTEDVPQCSDFGGYEADELVAAPANKPNRIKIGDKTIEYPSTSVVEIDGGNDKGTGVSNAAKDISERYVNQQADLTLTGIGSIKGGKTSLKAKLLGYEVNAGLATGIFLGFICIIAGAVCIFYLKNVQLGLGFIVGGIICIVVSVYLTLIVTILIGGAVIAALILLFVYLHKRNSDALTTVVKGVESAPAVSADTVKASIKQAAGKRLQSVKKTISKIKASL